MTKSTGIKMKVLHVIASMETGGAQKLVRDLLPALEKRGVHTELLVYRRSDSKFERDIESAGIKIHSLDCDSIRSPFIAVRLVRRMRGFDIVHGHLFPVLYHLAIAGLICRKPLVYTEHSTTNRRRGKRCLKMAEKLVYRRYGSVISVSADVGESLSLWIGDGNGRPRMETVRNGIRVDEYREASFSVSPEDFWGRKGTAVLMAARFSAAKDQATVIRAIPLIHDKDVFVAFAGEGGTMQACVALAEQTGVRDRCLFLGDRDDIPRLIANSRIGVLSSYYEGFGLSAVEAMAGGKPLVASDIPGLSGIVKGYGLVFETGDERGLAGQINRLLDDVDFYERVAGRCHARAGEYDIAGTADGYERIYRNLMSER